MMELEKTSIEGVFLVRSAPAEDERGSFARLYCAEKMAGFTPRQTSLSQNPKAGTLRGMHFQKGAAAEKKLVTCLRGKIFDVALDLRPASPTYKKWFGAELAAGRGLLIPQGCAHGFLTLEDNAEVLYQIEGFYDAAAASGVRFNDPAFSISWPRAPLLLSVRDGEWPDYAG